MTHDEPTALIFEMLLAPQVTDTTARLFAADCAEHVLHHFEAMYPDDTRPRKAIDAARAYARGTISREEMVAAGDAAWAAARAAARAAGDAARAAARAAGDAARAAALVAAGDAAWAAARAAARAAGDAAGAAAGDAEREWQANRLSELCGLDPTSDTVAGP